MIKIKTYQDLLEVGENEKNRMDFVLAAISEHKSSEDYRIAIDAELYANGKNATIMNYKKLLYTITGEAVPDNYSANHKCASAFFKRFVTQEVAYLLGNGATFANEDTKEKLGKNFDHILYDMGKSARIQKVAFGFWNKDHIEWFKLTEFVPLFDEENGSIMAGIRFWQIDDSKPLRATLYELDGYTEYIKRKDEDITTLHEKTAYIIEIKGDEKDRADGTLEYVGKNYPTFPIVPLYANPTKESTLVGLRENIDCYDLIKSGFANDLDDASMIYWTLQNCGGMDDIDLVRFKDRMRTIGVANMENSDDGARAEAHTIEVPFQSRQTYLQILQDDLYKDAMALNVEKIANGSVTATQIDASYEPLNEKTDEFEYCVIEFIDGILKLAGIEDNATFSRSVIANKSEEINNIINSAEYLDDDYITEKIMTILGDKDRVEEVIANREARELSRYSALGTPTEESDTEEQPPESDVDVE